MACCFATTQGLIRGLTTTVDLEDLFLYFPRQHGEHGVDATLHMLVGKQSTIHEVFSNPPGASWTSCDILRPLSTEVYSWDHMPRVPEAKRPDLILQFNEREDMSFILLESKQAISDVYVKMGTSLTEFFTGSHDYLGLKKRPAWQRRRLDEEDWTLIRPDENVDLRYWFRSYPERSVHYWPGFTFASIPEYWETRDQINIGRIMAQHAELMRSYPDLHIVIMIGWHGNHHDPFAVRTYSDEFAETDLADELDTMLDPILVE